MTMYCVIILYMTWFDLTIWFDLYVTLSQVTIIKILLCYIYTALRPSCHLWATGKLTTWRSVVVQTQNVLFLVNCCSTTPVRSLNHQNCCSGTTGRAKEEEWRQNHCHDRYWSAKGGTVVVQGRQKHRTNWYTMFTTVRIIWPVADPCASILWPQWCACLLPASFERPMSDRPPRWPLGDCFEHAQNFTATMTPMAGSKRPLRHPRTTKANFLPSLCLQRRPGQFCGRTRGAQRSQPLCKGGIGKACAIDGRPVTHADDGGCFLLPASPPGGAVSRVPLPPDVAWPEEIWRYSCPSSRPDTSHLKCAQGIHCMCLFSYATQLRNWPTVALPH